MIEFTLQDKILTCRITDEIVASRIPEMRSLLGAYLDNHNDWSELIFDCQSVSTLDSIGVNFVVGAFKKAQSSNRTFKITGCNEPVLKVLSLFKLNEKFEVLSSSS
jgi:anti-anti-sigma factor